MGNTSSKNLISSSVINPSLSLEAITITEKDKQDIIRSFQTSKTLREAQPILALDVSDICYTPGPMQSTSHWGLYTQGHLFHLVFYQDKQTKAPLALECEFKSVPQRFLTDKTAIKLGTTKYGFQEIFDIANTLIQNFGTYHRVFWNCQHFVSCLLEIICDPGFTQITTSTDVLRKVLFSSLLLSPIVTTTGIVEQNRRHDSIQETERQLELIDKEIISSLPKTKTGDDASKLECNIM